jgi:elongation factor G
MKTYQPAEIRNVAIVGHASGGKTMLSECMLACGGVINRLGSIANGTTVSDYHEDEQHRHISIHSSLLHTEWLGRKINLIDTPGYLDFISESMSSLRVCDLAISVIHAQHGIGVGTEQTWECAVKYDLPKVIVINAIDKENIDLEALLIQIRGRFGEHVLPLTWPVKTGPGASQIVDVFSAEVLTYVLDGTGKCQAAPATGAIKDKAAEFLQKATEDVAEADDALLEKFFESGGLSPEELKTGLRNALSKHAVIPLFVTASETNVGVNRLLDFLAEYAPSPVDHPKFHALDAEGEEVELASANHEPVLYVFKTISEPQFGDMSYFRLWSGELHLGLDLYNSTRKASERIGQFFQLNGKNRIAVNSLAAGDLGALVKLKITSTGHTLCHAKHPVSLPPVVYPKPNIHAALKLTVKGEEDKVAQGLAALHAEDPTFLYHVDGELHQTVISAQGGLHLEVVADRLRKRYKVDIELTEPLIPYREAIKGRGESKYRHKKQTGGAGQFAEVWMRIEPKPRDTGMEFIHSLSGQNVDRVFVPSVEKGVQKACTEGILAGYRVVDVKIDFYDGKMHPVDSKDIAFQIAGYFAFKEAFAQAKPCLLEPINNIEIRIPDDCMGKVMGDLSSRRGKIQGMDTEGTMQVIRAQVPQKELYRYSTTIRSLTGGRGIHSEEFSHYEEMQRDMEQKVIEDSKHRKKDHKEPE